MRLRLIPALILAIATGTFTITAQDDDPIRVDSSIVRLNIGVVDQRGRPRTDLTRGDFAVFEDGIRQQISSFQPVTEPFSVVLALDMSGSTLPFRQTMKQAATRFIDALGPRDRVSVIEFYDKVNIRTEFTSDAGKILFAINASNGRGKTQFYKALDMAIERLEKERNRRKAVIVLSDGIDTAAQDEDRERLLKLPESAVPNAIRPDELDLMNRILRKSDNYGVTIYALALPTGDPAKLADPTARQIEMYRAARERLRIVAERTGGTLNTINRLEEMGRLYAEVAADLRTLYTIDYQPSNDRKDGKWRTIRIETADPALIARTRTGYFAR